LEQNFGLRFRRGAISEVQGRVSAMLTLAYHAIKQQLLNAPIVHVEETSNIRSNESRWLWHICTDKLFCFMAHHSPVRWPPKSYWVKTPNMWWSPINISGITTLLRKQKLRYAHILRNVSALAQIW
jgi:transposase